MKLLYTTVKKYRHQSCIGILTQKPFRALLVAAALLWTATSLIANPDAEVPFERHTDSAPHLTPPIIYPSVDSAWDLLFYTDVEAICGDNQIVGCAYADGKFFISGGNNGINPNMLYILDSTGVLLNTFIQPTPTSWGWRDMAYDGTYLYAGDNGDTVYAFDTDGNLIPSLYIPRPSGVAMVRALAYDPVTDHFWTGNFSAAIVEFDRDGNVISSGSPAPLTAVYGMAWDEVTPGGPWLWIYDQGGTPLTTFHKYDPIAHDFTGEAYTVPLLPGSIDQRAGGCEITDQWDPQFWTMVAITQGVPDDMLYILEIMDKSAPAAPNNLTVTNNGPDLIASLSWTNPTSAINGNPLTAIDSIQILRNNSPLASLTGSPGQAMVYDDDVPVIGMYNYVVYCVNNYGNGLSSQSSVWIGLDTPGPPGNVTATPDPGQALVCTITWDAPTLGAHGGYWPAGSWEGQKIYRNEVEIVDLSGTNTSYIDSTVPEPGFYTYGVSYYNSSGESTIVNAPEVMVSNPLYQPMGPDDYGYWAYDIYDENGPEFRWIEVNPAVGGPGTLINFTQDDQTVHISLPFSFQYYGQTYSEISVCSNGWIAMGYTTDTDYSNSHIPHSDGPPAMIAPFWEDLSPQQVGNVAHYYDASEQYFVVEFDSVRQYLPTSAFETFEVVLYDPVHYPTLTGDGQILFQYNLVSDPSSNTVGIENPAETIGLEVLYNGDLDSHMPPLEPGVAILFSTATSAAQFEVTLTPSNPPIQIPVSGGAFEYNIAVANNSDSTATFDVWCDVILPDSTVFGPLLGPINITAPAGFIGDRDRTQSVPGSAPEGIYTYNGYVGIYPNNTWDQDTFDFEKLTTGDGPVVNDWANTGESLDDWMESGCEIAIPDAYSLNQNYPNPFNPTTTITYALPKASRVNLVIYDISGRVVATLVNVWREAGNHEVIFDGSKIASGVYIYQIHAGEFQASGKMVLMK